MQAVFDFPRAELSIVEEVGANSAATLHEALGQSGTMLGFIKPIYPGMKLFGSALTVDCPPGDNLTIHAAVERARPGDVLVVDFKGFSECGPFGDVLATACRAKGIKGLIIDGCVRDGPVLREMGFPVLARGLNMKAASKKICGSIGIPISCAGVAVSPGDIVVADDDGVVVVPIARAEAVIAAALDRESKEEVLKDQLRGGRTTIELLNLRGLLVSA